MADAAHTEHATETRLIVMGGAELTLGFRLIGFETYPDANGDDVDRVLRDLIAHQQQALVLLEPGLARSGAKSLDIVRNEGGRIVVSEIPALHAPHDYHPEVEDVVRSVLGPGALEDLE